MIEAIIANASSSFKNNSDPTFRFMVHSTMKLNDNESLILGQILSGNLSINDIILFYPIKSPGKVTEIQMGNKQLERIAETTRKTEAFGTNQVTE